MVDESLEDQVWVTVVATRYSGPPASKHAVEPQDEPHVQRSQPTEREREEYRLAAARAAAEPPPPSAPAPRVGLGVSELDVPEFMPRRY
jgi:hypothetical protein